MKTLATPLHSLPALHLHHCAMRTLAPSTQASSSNSQPRTLSRNFPSALLRCTSTMTMIDETYEFSVPRFFDFINGKTEKLRTSAGLSYGSILHSPTHLHTSKNVEENFQETIKQPQSMTTEIKEDDAPCSEVKEENNTTTSHVVPVDTERSEDVCKGKSSCLGISPSGDGSAETEKPRKGAILAKKINDAADRYSS
ncbi:hypothetical protein AHAS_Ahas01G0183700 [Arachis hypogaea]